MSAVAHRGVKQFHHVRVCRDKPVSSACLCVPEAACVMTASALNRINGPDVQVLGRSDRQSLSLFVVCVDGVLFRCPCTDHVRYTTWAQVTHFFRGFTCAW